MFGNYFKGFMLIVIAVLFSLTVQNYEKTIFMRDSIDDKISMACYGLINSIDTSIDSADNISQGYLNTSLNINQDAFIKTFNDTLHSQVMGDYITSNIACVIIVNKDELDVYNYQIDRWQPKQFFSYETGGQLVYLSSQSSDVYIYDASGNKVNSTIGAFGIGNELREDTVIDKINQEINKYTSDVGMNIKNINESVNSEKYKQRYFNPLDDLTVIVVYKEDISKGALDLLDFMKFDINLLIGFTVHSN